MSLTINGLRVALQGKEILHHIDLHVKEGEFVSLLGPSGCGKTTLLKSIAGLLDVQEGDIRLGDHSVLDWPPQKRGTVIVFQDLRLFPNMTVEKNIAFPMELKKISKKEQKETVERLLDEVQLAGYGGRKIRQLSGGQMQRVALARALAASPRILLLDEPFSGLDERLRLEMEKLVRKLHDERRTTTILVTHDKREALQMSDRIALMEEGDILQYAGPEEIFFCPASRNVAEYFGKANYIRGTVKDGTFISPLLEAEALGGWADGAVCDAMVRPFQILLSPGGEYEMRKVVFMGETAEVILQGPQGIYSSQVMSRDLDILGIREGKNARIRIQASQVPCFPVEKEETK